ncbi:hypothetical protein NC653_012651 [Populus alba x Populus x berolinensis]|uniref:Uncharacterized protein n=1 Tax=Populus alba x Populus x berolinensis TaxID=444605 RepID=A0AAD6QSG2_9ROSI|nr:hypothetical protein NC653_012651 [Populus alba x Populus x berolinensis]
MKSTVVIFVLGLTFLHLQVDAKRLVLKEISAEKTDNQPAQCQQWIPGIKVVKIEILERNGKPFTKSDRKNGT